MPNPKSKRLTSNAFTLIEIIMAMAIMTIGIIGVVRLLPVGLRASKSAEMLSRAAFLAQEKLEELKLSGFEAITAPESSIPLEGEEGMYSWAAEVSELVLEGLGSCEDIRRISLTVGWQEKDRPRLRKFITFIGKEL